MGRNKVLYPWERQPGETEKAYEAFLFYKNLGPGRTLAETSRKLPKNYQTLKEWKAKWKWEDRVIAFDRENDRQEQRKLQHERVKMVKRHINLGTYLQVEALKAIKRKAKEADDDKEGNGEGLPLSMARDLLQIGLKLENQARRTAEMLNRQDAPEDSASLLVSVLDKAWPKEGNNEH